MSTVRASVVVGVADKQTGAVRYAVAEARRLRRPLRVVHCWAAPMPTAEVFLGSEMIDAMKADGTSVLGGARATIEEIDPGLDAEYILDTGTPVEALINESRDADSVVIGADDVPWIERFLGGEVSGNLTRSAHCPVVVVPESDLPHTSGGGVVVTIDGDGPADGPLRYGFEQAGLRHETLHVLHVAPESSEEGVYETHRATLAEVVAGWQEQFPGVNVRRSTTQGDPAESCIAATSESSLVIIGHHHGRAMPFGRARHVAMTVLRNAHCPVAVVPLDYGVV